MIAVLGAACGSSTLPHTGGSQPGTPGRASLLTYGIVPPQLPPPTRLRAVVNAVKELAGTTTVQVHLYTEWNTYPSSLPGLDAEIASHAAAGEHVDIALLDAPPAGVAGNPQGFAAFVAAMVAHFAKESAGRLQWYNI